MLNHMSQMSLIFFKVFGDLSYEIFLGKTLIPTNYFKRSEYPKICLNLKSGLHAPGLVGEISYWSLSTECKGIQLKSPWAWKVYTHTVLN